MARLPFAVYDVFTDQRFAGNPLAVVFDADGLATEAMQAIAREFNLSETIFVCAPLERVYAARVRIFTPRSEMPFAGHPTIGCAVALAERRFSLGDKFDALIVLEENVGPVRCAVSGAPDQATFAEFVAPRAPEEIGAPLEDGAIAKALGLDAADIGFDRHRPSLYSAGAGFAYVPLASLDALARASSPSIADARALGGKGVFIYTRLPAESPHAFRARMFAPADGIEEDPATGSAAAAFAGVAMRFDALGEGLHNLPIEQGVEMGRPSLIGLALEIENGVLKEVRIGGRAVEVSTGEISAP